jgi:hypothetical protein
MRISSPLNTSSSMQSSSTFYQQSRHIPSPYSQQYPSRQPSQTSYPSPLSQGSSALSHNTDSFRAISQPVSHSQSPYTTAVRQQQPLGSHAPHSSHNAYSHFSESPFIDSLESVANSAAGVSPYGTAISRAGSTGGYGAGAGVTSQMSTGFESLSDNDIRDRLLRGIGRR